MYRILATSLLAAVFTMTGCPGSDAQDPGCLTSLKEVKFTAPSGNSSLVSMQFHAVDCNGKPVSNLDIGSVRAVEIVNGDVVDLSPTETKANFYPKHRSYATTVAFAIDFSASIYSYPDRLKTLRDSVIAFGKTALRRKSGCIRGHAA